MLEAALDSAKMYHKVVQAGEEWADKKAAYELYDDFTKITYSDIVTALLPLCKTKGEAETKAYTDSKYREHMMMKGEARKAWLLAEVRYRGLQMLAELRRSEESTRRAEMQLR